MKQLESGVVREVLTACAHRRIQVLDPKMWSKANPPPFTSDDPAIAGVVWRANTGGAKYAEKYFVRFGIPGQPDVQGIFRGGFPFGFECKQGKGKASVYQVWYHGLFRGLGMRIAVVYEYQEAITFLDQWIREIKGV